MRPVPKYIHSKVTVAVVVVVYFTPRRPMFVVPLLPMDLPSVRLGGPALTPCIRPSWHHLASIYTVVVILVSPGIRASFSVRFLHVTYITRSTPTRPHPYCNYISTRISYGLGPGASAHKAKLPGMHLVIRTRRHAFLYSRKAEVTDFGGWAPGHAPGGSAGAPGAMPSRGCPCACSVAPGAGDM